MNQSTSPKTTSTGSTYKIIGYSLRHSKRNGSLGIAFSLMWAIGSVAVAKALGYVIDSQIIPSVTTKSFTVETLVAVSAIMIGSGLLVAFGIYGRRAFAWALQYDLHTHYRSMLVKSYLNKSMEWHRNHPKGRLIAYVSSDAETAAGIGAPLPMAIGTIFLGLFAFIGVFILDWVMSLILVTMLPLLVAGAIVAQRYILVAVKKQQESKAIVSSIAQESFEAALMVKTMGKQQSEGKRFLQASEQLRDDAIWVGYIAAVFMPVYMLIPTLGMLGAVILGVVRIQAGVITPGDLMNIVFLINIASMPMRIIGSLLREMFRSTVASERIKQIVSQDFETTKGTTHLPATNQGATITLTNVSYEYEDETLYMEEFSKEYNQLAKTIEQDRELDANRSHLGVSVAVEEPVRVTRGVTDVTFEVAAGSTVALVGKTGSGKSTLASLVGDLLTPQQGTVLVDGVPVHTLDDESLAATVGFAFQKAFLFNDTVRNNITLYDTTFTDEQINHVVALTQLTDTIAGLPLGLETVVGERGTSLSGGQRQRVALARALIRKPRLLVLDDATSALDSTVELNVLSQVLGEKPGGMTTLIVANRMSSILSAERIVLMEDGRIADEGTHEELLARSGLYADIVRTYEEETKE